MAGREDVVQQGRTGQNILDNPPTILIADDDPIFLAITSAMVRKMGYSILTASDGKEAVEQFEKHQLSVTQIVIDVNMPKMSGIAAIQQIQQQCGHVRAIVVSGYTQEEQGEQFSAIRNFSYLQKPLSFECLHDALKQPDS